MAKYEIRNFKESDIPAVMELQRAHQQVYTHAGVVPGEVYLSAGFEAGRNIFCAFDENGKMLAYAPVFPTVAEQPQFPNVVWTEVKARPDLAEVGQVKDRLFQRVLERAGEAARLHPGQKTRLTFQYHPSEKEAIEFVTARGCAYSESIFRMGRDLSSPIEAQPCPPGIELRRWHMDSEAEQRAYITARNEAFPDAPTALADWQNFLRSPEWKEGTSITAFEAGEIAGSVSVFWDEALSAQLGRKIGFTEYIFTRPKWRGRGIAALMIREGLRYLQEHRRESALLEVKAANANALNLYLRLGFEIVDETRLYILDL